MSRDLRLDNWCCCCSWCWCCICCHWSMIKLTCGSDKSAGCNLLVLHIDCCYYFDCSSFELTDGFLMIREKNKLMLKKYIYIYILTWLIGLGISNHNNPNTTERKALQLDWRTCVVSRAPFNWCLHVACCQLVLGTSFTWHSEALTASAAAAAALVWIGKKKKRKLSKRQRGFEGSDNKVNSVARAPLDTDVDGGAAAAARRSHVRKIPSCRRLLSSFLFVSLSRQQQQQQNCTTTPDAKQPVQLFAFSQLAREFFFTIPSTYS